MSDRIPCPECESYRTNEHTKDGAGFVPDGFLCMDCLTVFYPKNVQYRLTQINRLERRLLKK